MSTDNVEVYRCKECSETVLTVPAGFALDELKLRQAELEHLTLHCEIEAEAGLVWNEERA